MLYSGRGCGHRNKTEAFKCYQKAANARDGEAINSMGLMIESGFDDRQGNPEAAVEYYIKAQQNGCIDALVNHAAYRMQYADKNDGKILLMEAYRQGNQKAADYMIHFELFKSRKEIESAAVNF